MRNKEAELRRLVAVACALGLALAATAGAPASAQAAGTSALATSSASASGQRVRGSVPVGKARIQSTRTRKPFVPARPSEGQLAGLHRGDDPLDLKSSVALVVDQDTDEVLFEKNTRVVLPIASITKLMTALVTVEANLPLDEDLTVTQNEVVRANVRSNLRPGMRMTRDTALHLALMSSENRAAQLLGATYPGGLDAFVEAMNAKARMLGMMDSHFSDPTGLSPDNRSSANDLVRLVKAAYEHDVIRQHSISGEMALPVGKRVGSLRQHQPPDGQSGMGHRAAEDRLYLRGRSLPRDAGGCRRAAHRHGAARFRRKVFTPGRRPAHPRLARGQTPARNQSGTSPAGGKRRRSGQADLIAAPRG